MGKFITLAELGRLLGLDKSSVSLALRDSEKVSARTRARVRAAAKRYGYRPNLAARQLRSNGPQSVCLVLPLGLETLAHAEPVSTIRVLSDLAARGGLLFTIVCDARLGSIFDGASGYPLLPDGVFIWGNVPADACEVCDARDIPHVTLDPNHLSYGAYAGPQIRIDNQAGAAAVTRHLIDRGARRLLFIQTTTRHLGHEERWQAARRQWLEGREDRSLVFRQLADLTDRDLLPFVQAPRGAIQCSNDDGAVQVWHRLNRLGVAVPDRVLLAGFDGNPIGQMIDLTTALFDATRLAETGWDMLCTLMTNPRGKTVRQTVPVALRVGSTT